MILKGKARSGGRALGVYLSSQGKNERVKVLEIRGTIAKDVFGAILEMDAYAAGTRCQKALYHVIASPQPGYPLTPEQQARTVDAIAKEFGFEGHARVVVAHLKDGSEHLHIVFSRIDLERMRAVSDSHSYARHEKIARALEREFGHPRVQGAHIERDGVERPERAPTHWERLQEDRTGVKGRDVKAEVTALFRGSDGPEAFVAAVQEAGYVVAQGDRRDFIIIDRAGGTHSLARRIEGVKAAELRAFMAPLDRDAFPTEERAKEIQIDRMRGERNASDEISWEDDLAKSAIEHDQRLREAAEELLRKKREAFLDDKIEAAYARGDDYVSQAGAAQRDHQRRQKRFDRLLDRLDDFAREPGEIDRQREGPGGGRFRTR